MDKKTENSKSIEITPPHNLEAEQAVLGAIMLRPQVMDEIVDLLKPVNFYRTSHGKIFQAMMGLYARNEPVDLVTVTARLQEVGWLEEVGGPVFLAELSEQVGTATNAGYYAQIVYEKSMLRNLLDRSQEIAAACLGRVEDATELINWAEDQVFQVAETGLRTDFQSLADLIPGEVERIENLYYQKTDILGIPSGFADIDKLTCGFQKGNLIIIASRPSMGKTALALNIAFNATHKAKTPAGIFSLEMAKEELVQRLMASQGEINSTRLKSGKMGQHEWLAFSEVGGLLMDTPIYLSEKPSPTPIELRAQARRLKARHGVGLIIVDYLQLIHDPRARSREQEVAGISRSLKTLAKELGVPVIALSQLSRRVEERKDKRPVLADLRESGAIEADADLVFFIYRDEVYNENSADKGVAEVRLAKQRNGPLGLIKLTYREEFMRFENHISTY